MGECFKCGVSEDRALLFGAVLENGIVKICRKCSFEEDIPIMKYIEEKVEKRQTVHERLSRLSGIEMKNEEDKINIQISKEAKDESLMKIANENFRKNVLAPRAYTASLRSRRENLQAGPEKSSTKIFTGGNKNPFGMIDNFHWVIMRARRAKKLNQKQFAEAIEESEEAIKIAEEGILPKNDFVLVNKIENYLGIVLREEFARAKSFDKEVEIVKEEFVQNVKEDNVKFDDTTTKTLIIADLQEMKQKREEAIFNDPAPKGVLSVNKDVNTEGKKIDLDKEDLSQEEIDRILFGK